MTLGKQRHVLKYRAVRYFHDHKSWRISWMCRHLEISRAGYYKWLHREVPEAEKENIALAGLIKEYDERFNHILGYRRMTAGIQPSMSRVGHCIDNGPIEGFWGIIKTEMYQMYQIDDEESLRFAIEDYLRFYSVDLPQGRFHCQTPLEIRTAALSTDQPVAYPILVNKRILKYKAKWQTSKKSHTKVV